MMADVTGKLLGPIDLTGESFKTGSCRVEPVFRNGEITYRLRCQFIYEEPPVLKNKSSNLSLLFQRYAAHMAEKGALDVQNVDTEINRVPSQQQSLLRRTMNEYEKQWHGSVAMEWFVRYSQNLIFPENLLENARNRWRMALQNIAPEAVFFVTHLSKRAAVGLANASPWENSGWAFHYTYGVPIIPGDSLKGLARHFLEDEYHEKKNLELLLHLGIKDPKVQEKIAGLKNASGKKINMTKESLAANNLANVIFGGSGADRSEGLLAVYDAWPFSEPKDKRWFELDVLTSHHKKYYSGNINIATDTENPIPVHHLALRPGLAFEVAIGLTDPALKYDEEQKKATITVGKALLYKAFEDWGVGAKTGSGYGRMKET